MKVYVVFVDGADQIEGIFYSKEKAIKCKEDSIHSCRIEEHELICHHLYEAYSPNGQIFSSMSLARCKLCGYIPSDKETK